MRCLEVRLSLPWLGGRRVCHEEESLKLSAPAAGSQWWHSPWHWWTGEGLVPPPCPHHSRVGAPWAAMLVLCHPCLPVTVTKVHAVPMAPALPAVGAQKLCTPMGGPGSRLSPPEGPCWGERPAWLHSWGKNPFHAPPARQHAPLPPGHGPPSLGSSLLPVTQQWHSFSTAPPWKCARFLPPTTICMTTQIRAASTAVLFLLELNSSGGRKVKTVFEERGLWSNWSQWLTCYRSDGEKCSETTGKLVLETLLFFCFVFPFFFQNSWRCKEVRNKKKNELNKDMKVIQDLNINKNTYYIPELSFPSYEIHHSNNKHVVKYLTTPLGYKYMVAVNNSLCVMLR